jgi:hypothetical protein
LRDGRFVFAPVTGAIDGLALDGLAPGGLVLHDLPLRRDARLSLCCLLLACLPGTLLRQLLLGL